MNARYLDLDNFSGLSEVIEEYLNKYIYPVNLEINISIEDKPFLNISHQKISCSLAKEHYYSSVHQFLSEVEQNHNYKNGISNGM